MPPSECGCSSGTPCQKPPAAGKGGKTSPARAMAGSWVGIALGVGATLMPKCPLCVAGYLSLFGLSTAAAGVVAPLFFPLGIALALLSFASMAYFARRMRVRPR